jgi:hypothetical protein
MNEKIYGMRKLPAYRRQVCAAKVGGYVQSGKLFRDVILDVP